MGRAFWLIAGVGAPVDLRDDSEVNVRGPGDDRDSSWDSLGTSRIMLSDV